MELVRNESYWGEPATFDRCVFLEVEEEAAEETMFGNGDLDVYAPRAAYRRLLTDPKFASLIARSNHYETESPMNGYYFVAWNQKGSGKDTLFTDARVRRAMTMLTDRDRICHDVFLDYAKPTSGPFAQTSPQADPSIKPWPYDVAGAKALLEEAGYKDRDGSGVLKNDKGEAFRFRLTYGANNATVERFVLFMKDSYAKAGVTMEPDPVDSPNLEEARSARFRRDHPEIGVGRGAGKRPLPRVRFEPDSRIRATTSCRIPIPSSMRFSKRPAERLTLPLGCSFGIRPTPFCIRTSLIRSCSAG